MTPRDDTEARDQAFIDAIRGAYSPPEMSPRRERAFDEAIGRRRRNRDRVRTGAAVTAFTVLLAAAAWLVQGWATSDEGRASAVAPIALKAHEDINEGATNDAPEHISEAEVALLARQVSALTEIPRAEDMSYLPDDYKAMLPLVMVHPMDH